MAPVLAMVWMVARPLSWDFGLLKLLQPETPEFPGEK